MFRLAFIMAVFWALFLGQTGVPSGDATSPLHHPETAWTSQGDADLPQPGVAAEPVVVEDSDSDDEVSVREEDRTVRGDAARVDDPIVGFGVGPSQSHARPMERPPRV